MSFQQIPPHGGKLINRIVEGKEREELIKAAAALKAYNDLKEKYATLFHDKEVLLQRQTDARIAELTIYDYEAIHKAKLALLKEQLSANPALLKAALSAHSFPAERLAEANLILNRISDLTSSVLRA